MSEFNGTWIFSTDFYEKAHISNLIKIRPTESIFFHVDGHDEAVVAFCNLGNVTKNSFKSNKP